MSSTELFQVNKILHSNNRLKPSYLAQKRLISNCCSLLPPQNWLLMFIHSGAISIQPSDLFLSKAIHIITCVQMLDISLP